MYSVMILLSFIAFGHVQSTIYSTRFEGVTWDDSNWRLSTSIADQGHYQARASLANGYIGINLAALGPFFEVDEPVNGDNINGWPLFQRRQAFATVAGFWDQQPETNGTNFPWLNQYGGESVISGIPHWSGLVVECGGQILNASTDLSQVTGFTSTWDFRAAVLSWRFTWTPPACSALDIAYSTFVHKLNIHQAAVQLQITTTGDANVTVSDILDGDGATRAGFVEKASSSEDGTIWTAVHPDGVPAVNAYVYSTVAVDEGTDAESWTVSTDQAFGPTTNASSIAQSSMLHLRVGQTCTVNKFVGIASSDAIAQPQTAAQRAALDGRRVGYPTLLRSHVNEWQMTMTPDSVDSWHLPSGSLPQDPNIIEQQILSVTNPFSILQQTVGQNAFAAAGNNEKLLRNSITVGGLGSDSYAGLVFWDVEVWMQPGIVLSHPSSMQQVANYRTSRLPQARTNVQTAFTSSQNETAFSPNSAIYSWTSGRAGNCTGTGPCFDYEYHINGDIALELENYWTVTGDKDTFENEYFPTYSAAAQVYSDLLYLNETTQTYMLRNATDPDEFANNVNNPAYTMLLMQTILNRANDYRKQFGMPADETWAMQADAIEVPEKPAASIHLEYTGMNGTINVKQADVVLIYDLLRYQSQYRQGDLGYYAGKQSLDGPGMTYGVFSIVTSEEAQTGCSAYTYNLWGSQPYARAPWFQYSEQLVDDYETNGGFHPAYPFLTGQGGANRVAPYGFLGLRLQQSNLNVNPTMPPQIPYLNHRTFYWQGHAINATSNSTHTTLLRLNKSLRSANPLFAPADSTHIPVTVGQDRSIQNISLTQPLIIPNRLPHLNRTIDGNLAQCLPVTSSEPYAPGQFPLAAVDGAASTKWQPQSPQPATLSVHLGDAGIAPVSAFHFDWAQAPPQSYSVAFSNVSTADVAKLSAVSHSSNISISNPYDVDGLAAVVPYSSNTTNVTLPAAVMGGRYAFLTIAGNQAYSGENVPGASVAEWAIITAKI